MNRFPAYGFPANGKDEWLGHSCLSMVYMDLTYLIFHYSIDLP